MKNRFLIFLLLLSSLSFQAHAACVIGIDLADDCVTPNGANPRPFPNDGQNYPVILSVVVNPTTHFVTITGTLDSVASSQFLIQLFTNQTNVREGEVYFNQFNVTTDANGHVAFTVTFDPISGNYLTATATQLVNSFPTNTSEFSAPVLITTASTVMNQFYTTMQNTPLSVPAPGVLVGSTGSGLSAILVTPPLNGTVVLNADGSFVYTPNFGFVGNDQFTFQATDGVSTSDIATAFITVLPPVAPIICPTIQ